MKTNVGLWIDHKKAIVVAITDKGEEIRLTISKVQRQLRRSGDSPLEGPHERQRYRPMIAAREGLRDSSIPTTMRSLRVFAMQSPF
jgi:hypothetical protein